MKLGLTCHSALDFRQARQAFDEAFAVSKQARAMPPPALPPAPHPLRLPWYEPTTLDPTLATDMYSSGDIQHLFSGLMALDPEMDVLPDVAHRWEVREGGRRFVFHLRNDARWSDGVLLTAHDFEYAWKRVLDPETASQNASLLLDIKGARALRDGHGHERGPLGVRALDAVTLEVELEEPVGYFLHLLSHPVTYPVPRHVVEAQGAQWAQPGKIVSNGPFRLEDWRAGEWLRLAHCPESHAASSGNVHEVVLFFLTALRSAELEMYEADELDAATLADPSVVDMARRRHPGEYLSFPVLSTLYVGFNAGRPPFDDVRVRQAFLVAVDRERLADVHLSGHVFPALGGFVPPGMPGHSPGIGLPYDPDRARGLLDQAGYPGGRGFPAVEALAPGLRVDERGEVVQLQRYWRDSLGVEVKWQALQVSAWLDRLNSEPPHLHLGAWMADYPDPDSFLRASPFRHRTRWRNETYDRLVEAARRATEQAQRISIYRQADALLVEEAPLLPIYYDRGHLLVKPWVSRFPTSSLRGYGHWQDVIIEPH